MVFSIVQSSIVFGQVGQGFGKALANVSPSELVALQNDGFAADVLYLVTVWLTKCSIALLFIRLSPDEVHVRSARVCLVASTAFMVVSIFITSLKCDLGHPWLWITAQCSDILGRWEAVGVMDMLTEIGLFAIAILMTYGLRLSLSKKMTVLLAFGLRLPILIPIVYRLIYLQVEFSSVDPTLSGVLASVCMQIQISYAIIATTTPCLRPFMSALSTHYGGSAPHASSTINNSLPGNSKLTTSRNSTRAMTAQGLQSLSGRRRTTFLDDDIQYGLGPMRSQVPPLSSGTTEPMITGVREHSGDHDEVHRDLEVAGEERDLEAGIAAHMAEESRRLSAQDPRCDYRVSVVSDGMENNRILKPGAGRAVTKAEDMRGTISGESRRMIIRRSTEWAVDTEEARDEDAAGALVYEDSKSSHGPHGKEREGG